MAMHGGGAPKLIEGMFGFAFLELAFLRSEIF
jgi:hypothetical protein